ncbi:MAG: hypothetical protein QXK07_04065 [Desulfurococcaceae archaeon]
MTEAKCLYYNAVCKALTRDERVKKIYEEDITKFIQLICSMCIKNRYSRAKERLSKKRYVVVNTL